MKILKINSANAKINLEKNNFTNKRNDINNNSLNNPIHETGNYGRYIAFGANNDSITAKIKNSLKTEIAKEQLDGLLLSSTDDYLTEFVPVEYNQIAHISGFSGENGTAFVVPDESKYKSRIFVDGRYYIQADRQIDKNLYTVEKIGLDTQGKMFNETPIERKTNAISEWAKLYPDKKLKIGFDPAQTSVDELNELKNALESKNKNITLVPTSGNPVDKIWQNKPKEKIMPVRKLPISLTGESSQSKLSKVRTFMKTNNIDIYAVTTPSDIAYLTNMRGQDIDYCSIFKSKLLLTQDKAILFCNPSKLSSEIIGNDINVKPEESFKKTVQDLAEKFDNPKTSLSSDANYSVYQTLKQIGTVIEPEENPVTQMKAIKNISEMNAYRKAIQKTDFAVIDLMNWLNQSIQQGKVVSEKDLSEMMTQMHKKYGALDLSFSTIPAAAENSALIHYEDGDPNKIIKSGDLVLVDTGAYYDSGLATDITRTWLAGGEKAIPNAKQKEIYTVTLKGALNGLFADLQPNATGFDLDSMVRNPIKEFNYDYSHSTGHGVGVEVHEFPYISQSKNIHYNQPLKEGMIFSIEPGVYSEGFGGVRFENLVTVIKHPDADKASKGWHKIKCLSFAPVDYNLIDKSLLNLQEMKWLEMFSNNSNKLLKKFSKVVM